MPGLARPRCPGAAFGSPGDPAWCLGAPGGFRLASHRFFPSMKPCMKPTAEHCLELLLPPAPSTSGNPWKGSPPGGRKARCGGAPSLWQVGPPSAPLEGRSLPPAPSQPRGSQAQCFQPHRLPRAQLGSQSPSLPAQWRPGLPSHPVGCSGAEPARPLTRRTAREAK